MVRLSVLMPVLPAVLLAACVQSGPAMRFFDGDITVAPPAGYCVNQAASQSRRDRGLALLGKCSFSGKDEAALIAVSLGESGSGLALAQGSAVLARHLQTPQGRASLARDGRANSVRIDQMAVGADQLVFHVEDRNAGPHWRALVTLKGRLTSISVQDPQGAPLARGQALVEQTLAALRKANAP